MAGPAKKGNAAPAKKGNTKKKTTPSDQHRQLQMQIVTVDVCHKCPNVCTRGVAYMEKMSHPGAIGRGVPCVLRMK